MAESAGGVPRASVLAALVFCATVVGCRTSRGAGAVWVRALAAELDASAWVGAAGDCVAPGDGADVGAAGGGSDERNADESGAGAAGSGVCRAADVGSVDAGADDRVGSSASAFGAIARATAGVPASGAEDSMGGGAVKGLGGGARRGGTIKNPTTAAAATAPKTITRVRVLFAGGSGALNLGALWLAPCFTARSAATCAA
jgi:hypothetical protein